MIIIFSLRPNFLKLSRVINKAICDFLVTDSLNPKIHPYDNLNLYLEILSFTGLFFLDIIHEPTIP